LKIFEGSFGTKCAVALIRDGLSADLVVANSVLAYVRDINDFIAGVAIILRDEGVATFEFHHLLNIVKRNQFDSIRHQHFSHLSLTAIQKVFGRGGLAVFDVEEISTHDGSVRLYASRTDSRRVPNKAMYVLLDRERFSGINGPEFYADFQLGVDRAKDEFLRFLLQAKELGKQVVAYGAAANGNTLLNYAGVRRDLISYVVDRNPNKQGKYLPGSRIPIVSEDRIRHERPGYVVILPWKISSEVIQNLDYIRKWDGQFVTAIPEMRVH